MCILIVLLCCFNLLTVIALLNISKLVFKPHNVGSVVLVIKEQTTHNQSLQLYKEIFHKMYGYITQNVYSFGYCLSILLCSLNFSFLSLLATSKILLKAFCVVICTELTEYLTWLAWLSLLDTITPFSQTPHSKHIEDTRGETSWTYR